MNEEEAMAPGLGAAHVEKTAFQAQCGTTFRVVSGDEQVPLLLVEVADGPAYGAMESFSLFFHGPADRLLEQGTHAFEHDELGSLALFVVPVLGSNADRIVYQVTFVRPRPAAPTQ
jgi:hypothetical protein